MNAAGIFILMLSILTMKALLSSAENIGLDPRCKCASTPNPLCADDNVTYKNKCFYRCKKIAMLKAGIRLKLRYPGECK